MTPSTQPAVRVSVGVGVQNRRFAWAGNPSPQLGESKQDLNGELVVEASWFPRAHVTSNDVEGGSERPGCGGGVAAVLH